MIIELRDLRWAIAASQHKSLRRAAATLSIRQSTLSRQLRDLEYRLGAELFERTNGGPHPTLIGQEFLNTARRIIEETDAAFVRLKAMSSGRAGRLRARQEITAFYVRSGERERSYNSIRHGNRRVEC